MKYEAWLVDFDGTLYHRSGVRLAMAVELALGGWAAIPCLQAFRGEQERLRLETREPLANPFSTQIERTAARLGRRGPRSGERTVIPEPGRPEVRTTRKPAPPPVSRSADDTSTSIQPHR